MDGSGNIVGLSDNFSGKNYIHLNKKSPLLSIGYDGKIYFPENAQVNKEEGLIELRYIDIGVSSTINYEVKDTHINFELKEITPDKKIDYVVWGPFNTEIAKTVGETVGIAQNDDFGIGIQTLNIKTLGGYPTNMDDTEPAYDIFATNNITDVSDSVKVLYRGQTARKTEYGSKLQAYCRDRSESKLIPVWGHENYAVPTYDDGGVTGSKIAIFGSQPSTILDVISEIELAEGLPHPMINGEWAKTSPEATTSYLIMSFDMDNFSEALDLTKKAGLKYLYHGGPFETWGHFKLKEKSFPENWKSMKQLVEKAEMQGIHLGVHTLSNFITTNDPYVTPVPDKRLAKVGSSILSDNVDISVKEIPIDDPMFFKQMENNNLHTVQVGDELIRYERITDGAPWKLLNCERGVFGTTASQHTKGDSISKLMDHDYRTFLSNAELSEEIAIRIADFCNTTGIRQISFDGLEGNWASGMGQYSRQLFVQTWYEHLKPGLKGEIINDASNPGHYFWHIFTRMNWGEPWYAGFRESQTQYRLMNQDYFQRNLMPHMLGWFQLSAETSIMDIEWLLARAAGFDAGFALASSFATIENNGLSDKIMDKIKQWETARLSGAFTDEQKELLKDIDNEFRLKVANKNEWDLIPLTTELFQYKKQTRQPGEPTYSTFEFSNPYKKQPLQFMIKVPENFSISNMSMELDNYITLHLPIHLSSGQIFKYEGGEMAIVYDKNWNKINEVAIDPSKLQVPTGNHEIKFDGVIHGDKVPFVKLEFTVEGEVEPVKSLQIHNELLTCN